MNYGSVCSGIEAATVAWHPLGWHPQWFSEIEKFPSQVLKHHYPHVPNLGDMMQLENNEIFLNANIDLLVGGTPCQSFSIAGLRGGLADVRGNLSLQFCRLLLRKRPTWFVWENVPGVLSSFTGEAPDGVPVWQTSDFATLLTAFSECGYCVAWRVLDSQFFGVPQRRERVFVVGHIGNDWRPPAAVLFEPEVLQGNIKAIKGTGAKNAGSSNSDHYRSSKKGINPRTIKANSLTSANNRFSKDDNYVIGTLAAGAHPGGFNGQDIQSNIYSFYEKEIRRLTPLEWERLQGFPDHYTAIPGAKDSPRYRAIGNSMAVPVMHWAGRRIDRVHKILQSTI